MKITNRMLVGALFVNRQRCELLSALGTCTFRPGRASMVERLLSAQAGSQEEPLNRSSCSSVRALRYCPLPACLTFRHSTYVYMFRDK